jgi:predicted nuclease of predicted toxin-antitoxin system
VKLLFDQNLSHRLVTLLEDIFPDSEHVRNVGLKAADDLIVWEYAKANGFMVVSKDSDFHQRSLVLGHPPKVVWVRLGNCSTADVAALLRHYEETIKALADAAQVAFLSLSW